MQTKKKYLCIETMVSNNSVSDHEEKEISSETMVSNNSVSDHEEKEISSVRTIPELSKCPASPEHVMAALQFLSAGMIIQISIKDEPIDFNKPVVEVHL